MSKMEMERRIRLAKMLRGWANYLEKYPHNEGILWAHSKSIKEDLDDIILGG